MDAQRTLIGEAVGTKGQLGTTLHGGEPFGVAAVSTK